MQMPFSNWKSCWGRAVIYLLMSGENSRCHLLFVFISTFILVVIVITIIIIVVTIVMITIIIDFILEELGE